jgi:murein DD-endopeptidase MepM/ murein hydrolase activator NlpD
MVRRRMLATIAVALCTALSLSLAPAAAAASSWKLPADGPGRLTWAVPVSAPASITISAVAKGRNGWYWPTGTDNVGTNSGWMDYRSWNHSWHLAKDIGTPYGSPVYALTDGVVFSAYSNLDGYGPGGGPGGAMVVLFRREDGAYFKALYGHIYGIKYKKGQAVKAGAVLAYINNVSPNHLHFGIHPGAALPTDPEHNPFRGHTYVKSQTYGWTDPIAFLNSHTPYVPPVPATLSTPTVDASVPAGTLVSVTARVSPAQDAGSAVMLERWRLQGTTWAFVGSSKMTLLPRSQTWRCSILLAAGSWRFRTSFSGDHDHLPGHSAYASVIAR